WRRVEPRIEIGSASAIGESPEPIVSAASYEGSGSAVSAYVTKGGSVTIVTERVEKNIVTDEETRTAETARWTPRGRGRAVRVLLTSGGAESIVACEGGDVVRLRPGAGGAVEELERFDAVPSPEARVSTFRWIVGQRSILVGDTRGDASTWLEVP